MHVPDRMEKIRLYWERNLKPSAKEENGFELTVWENDYTGSDRYDFTSTSD